MKKRLLIHLVLALGMCAATPLPNPTPTPWASGSPRQTSGSIRKNISITKTTTQAFRDGYIVIEGEGLPSANAATLGQRRLTAQRAAESGVPERSIPDSGWP